MIDFTRKGGVYSHKSGLYKIRERKGRNLEVQFTARPGIWESTGTKEFTTAVRQIDAMLINNGAARNSIDVLLKDFAKDFFIRTDKDSFQKRNELFNKMNGESFYRLNQGRLDNYIIPQFGDYRLRDITDIEIEDWYISLMSFADPTKELSDNSKIKVLETFKYVMHEAKRKRLITVNPCDDVQRITQVNAERKPFTMEEIQRMFPADISQLEDIWGSLQWAVFFSIMTDTGFRPGEVSALARENIDGNGVYTTSSIDARTRELKNSIKTSKKGQDYKVGILSDYTQRILTIYLAELDGEYLFIGKNGKFNRPEVSNKHLQGVLKRLGIPLEGRSQYCLRHTFSTFMRNNMSATIGEDDVRELMGHTEYRPEYDHRTPQDILFRLQKVKPVIDEMRA